MTALTELIAWTKDNPATAWGTLVFLIATATWVLKRS
jgi:hypothetical protein